MKELGNVFNGNCKVTRYDVKDIIESRKKTIEAVVEIASVCYNKDSSKMSCDKKEKLFKKLLVEQGGLPTEIIEFIPVTVSKNFMRIDKLEVMRSLRYFHKDYILSNMPLTNLRCATKSGFNQVKMPKLQQDNINSAFSIFKLEIPLFVVVHLLRHRNLSFNQRSNRYIKNTNMFVPEQINLEELEKMMLSKPVAEIKYWLKEKGVRKELINKFPNFFEMTEIFVASWNYNFRELINVRSSEHTMKETKEVIKMIEELLWD